MTAILAILANPVTIQLALSLLEAWANNKNASADQRATFLKMAETLRALGASEVKSRFESEDRQSSEIDQEWKDQNKG